MRFTFIFSLFVLTSCAQPTDSASVSVDAPVSEEQEELEVLETIVAQKDSFMYKLPWLESFSADDMIINRVLVPNGYTRVEAKEGSFAHWLRRIPLHPGRPNVKLYNGEEKWNQSAHAYVINMDVGKKDLQQCADAAMRLRAEYLYNNGKADSIHFNYTNGAEVAFKKWKSGLYPIPESGKVKWVASSKTNGSYESFKKYMIQIFNYAGTLSLSRELESIPVEKIAPGDLFVYGGSPGHAVMVMDVAKNDEGEIMFMIAQSYMPAQEMHILRNPNNESLSPWYKLSELGDDFDTPEWNFSKSELMRWN